MDKDTAVFRQFLALLPPFLLSNAILFPFDLKQAATFLLPPSCVPKKEREASRHLNRVRMRMSDVKTSQLCLRRTGPVLAVCVCPFYLRRSCLINDCLFSHETMVVNFKSARCPFGPRKSCEVGLYDAGAMGELPSGFDSSATAEKERMATRIPCILFLPPPDPTDDEMIPICPPRLRASSVTLCRRPLALCHVTNVAAAVGSDVTYVGPLPNALP